MLGIALAEAPPDDPAMKGRTVPALRPLALPLTFAALAALSACSFLTGTTVSGADLAEAAEDALEEQIGTRPEMDCGSDDIAAAVDKEVDCTVIDPATGAEYGATVTFTGVDGAEWSIDVKVDEAPAETPAEQSPEATTEDASTGAPADPAEGEPIPATSIAEAAEDALEGQSGVRPEIDCGAPELTIVPYEGRMTYCTLTDPADGLDYGVSVTFIGVSGNTWNVEVEVDAEPK